MFLPHFLLKNDDLLEKVTFLYVFLHKIIMSSYRSVATIAGSDPSGGAGIQADIKTISALGCYASSAITAVVNENTQGVYGMEVLKADFVRGQIESIFSDITIDAVKIGMLVNREISLAVKETLHKYNITNIVFDPVMVATSGDSLSAENIAEVFMQEIIPIARVVTPNIPEAEKLTGMKIENTDQMKEAAKKISQGRTCVMLKGGHLEEDILTDIFYDPQADQMLELPFAKVKTNNTHGTGCTLSSAIAAYLARGEKMLTAVVKAKEYINGAITRGAEYTIGRGKGPVFHFYNLWDK